MKSDGHLYCVSTVYWRYSCAQRYDILEHYGLSGQKAASLEDDDFLLNVLDRGRQVSADSFGVGALESVPAQSVAEPCATWTRYYC